ncbi:hypothetical protein [Cryobacterium sp. Y11]|uniref:hypothetical protein n=1 Tax=Cryobacterium sp. Y11 TaxID=2045016 RepID=UPI000CE5307E|nr:hypothetical protein [Cryobacterium sp. Y11]
MGKIYNDTWGFFDAGQEYASAGAALFGGFRKMVSGNYYGANGGMPGTNAFANQQMWAAPLWVPRAITIDRLACEVTALVAGSTVRLGLYGSTAEDTPGALVLDAGTVDSATTGIKEILALSTRIPAGLYWLAAVSQGGTPTLRSIGNSSAPPVASTLGGGSTGPNSYYQNGVVGALPATFTAVGASSGGTRVMAHIA